MKTATSLLGLWALFLGSVLAQEKAPARSIPSIPPNVAEKHLEHKVEPRYPQEARTNHAEGKVILKIHIDEKGNVSDLSVVAGHPMFVAPAQLAVEQWKYKPFLINDKPAMVETIVTVAFSPALDDAKKQSATANSRPLIAPEIAEKNLIYRVDPEYPPQARIAKIAGLVVLNVVIDEKGNVASVRGVSGHPMLVIVSQNAVKQWKYAPFLINGSAAEVQTMVKLKLPK
ncbi:MAG TPA: energy transducer TonB [Candidatus Angelobacter sp.]|jgi:TonB family protein